ncbi:hypothetical protein [Echinicola vietnamensis]|uniref:Uncharacterized protein n=1 Tax=Echinicola vietnamensis (strain DSM 17526 / LMG 23754 / KMM 6221) TaxID=926556 RepID=L0G0I7_ECHVK|nr:hypothetical protein [Echinicola vietnamensis]AGA78501.1 hypothetical protein Echvi_2253 [Echinicola vietnamensis DSM 17526]
MGKIKVFILSYLIVIINLSLPVQGLAQEPSQRLHVEGYFMQDSAKLGERVGYVLKAEYPSEMNIVFPDSTFQYRDFSFLEKHTFTSYTPDSVTLDSAIYFLSNFSLDSVKTYALPVFEILKYDSIVHYAPQDELALRFTIDPMPEELTFKDNDKYMPVEKDFNYPYLLIFMGIVLALALAVLLLFGKKIRKGWAAGRLKKQHSTFLKKWDASIQSLQSEPSLQTAEETLWLWRDYMEQLTGKPYKEWTATEIAEYLAQPELVMDFRKIEIIIYANRPAEDIQATGNKLKAVCVNMYNQKVKEIHERK